MTSIAWTMCSSLRLKDSGPIVPAYSGHSSLIVKAPEDIIDDWVMVTRFIFNMSIHRASKNEQDRGIAMKYWIGSKVHPHVRKYQRRIA